METFSILICLRLRNVERTPRIVTIQIYPKLALIVMGTEFRVLAEHLERDATRTAERLKTTSAFPSAQSSIRVSRLGSKKRPPNERAVIGPG